MKRSEAGDYILIDGNLLVQNVADVCHDPHHMGLESAPGGCIYRIRWLEEGAQWGFYRRAVPSVEHEREGIWWVDPKSHTIWEFRGFLKGEDWVTKL